MLVVWCPGSRLPSTALYRYQTVTTVGLTIQTRFNIFAWSFNTKANTIAERPVCKTRRESEGNGSGDLVCPLPLFQGGSRLQYHKRLSSRWSNTASNTTFLCLFITSKSFLDRMETSAQQHVDIDIFSSSNN